MSERKVLNKYYPPDFDPSKIPRMKSAKDGKFGIRLMAPFNMRCNTCGEYIYKGKKFNSRKETVSDEKYLGLYIFRFYIKCPRCIAEIAFKTDPENTDYTLEAGATRNFEALKTAERLAMKEVVEKEEDEKNNPMKVLENRTKASLQEMDMLETLEELKEIRSKNSKVDLETLLRMNELASVEKARREEQSDEDYVKSIFGEGGTHYQKRLRDSDDDDDDDDTDAGPSRKVTKVSSALVMGPPSKSSSTIVSKQKSALAGLIVRKKTVEKGTVSLDTPSDVSKSSVLDVTASTSTPTASTSATTGSTLATTASIVTLNRPAATSSTPAPTASVVSMNGLAGLAAYSSGSDSE